ncbi:uncharacterized protein LOC134240595, partial [Saccostrea cucullata]|uniref:uncharacterized protein LOC134240595 n=1 Tax=Saccostrea cuccullata TaxID=36930 RepID=UPI002ECFB523
MEVVLTLFCSFPNWCNQCSKVIIDEADIVTKVNWENCTTAMNYNMTVMSSPTKILLYENTTSCCEGRINITYIKGNETTRNNITTNVTEESLNNSTCTTTSFLTLLDAMMSSEDDRQNGKCRGGSKNKNIIIPT